MKLDLTLTKFAKLDEENRDTAINQMFLLSEKNGHPNSFTSGLIWDVKEDVKESLENGYDPEQNFTFYLNEFGEVKTKIA